MPVSMRHRVRQLLPFSLVFVLILLIVTAPRDRPLGASFVSEIRYSAPSSLLGLDGWGQSLPDPKLSVARAQASAMRARQERALLLLRLAEARADRAHDVAAPTTTAPVVPAQTVAGSFTANWYAIAQCESGGDWDYNGPSGFDGGLQFLPSTWSSLRTGYTFAGEAPPAVQIAAAQKLLIEVDGRGWTQWPVCWWRQ